MKTSTHQIELRGVRVHNLQNVDLDIPLGQLIVVTGVSGSGKSSLAFDTLYAEGQRRYVESFSTYSRRFLERFEKPDADRIDPIPPAVAVRQKSGSRSKRATVGTATEIYDSLRLLFARVGVIECPKCRRRIERHTPATAQAALERLEPGTRFVVCFPARAARGESSTAQARIDAEGSPAVAEKLLTRLTRAGFTKLIAGPCTVNIAETATLGVPAQELLVVVDRLTAGGSTQERLADSLETAFRHGDGSGIVLVQNLCQVSVPPNAVDATAPLPASASPRQSRSVSDSETRVVDGAEYKVLSYNARLICPDCETEFADPEPALFNFNSPLGACPVCRGTGEVVTAAGGGQSPAACPACRGTRLRPEAGAVRIEGKSIVALTQMTVAELHTWLGSRIDGIAGEERRLAEHILSQAIARLEYLREVGLEYLTLDRPARTLSGGEAQRVRLTAALGSKFVNMLYVLDEPTTGLHPRDAERLLTAVRRLQGAGNTVVVVEHDATIIRHADQVIDIGPGAGREGGRVVFQGSPAELAAAGQTATADFLCGRRRVVTAGISRRLPRGWLHIDGVEHHNLHGVSVDFPLGVLCVVTGVSGSGKSSLVEETLYPAIVAGLLARNPPGGEPAPRGQAGRHSSLTGLDQIDSVLRIDQGPIGKSARAIPASVLNLSGEIRTLFAETAEAKVHNFSARHFSFNSAEGGRCQTCRGAGSIAVDMQFLPDVVTTCPDCHGTRFRSEILAARYRGLSIAEVLGLTVREAFSFFRGRTRLQRRLKALKDAGLDYITLGQPADTLSGGESQRLKLASFLSRASRSRTLFIVDEPTTGLHPADVARLVDCFGQLLAGGHSLVVIEHNLDLIRCADYIVDLGPGAGAAGGRIVATGTPEEIAQAAGSATGRFLAE